MFGHHTNPDLLLKDFLFALTGIYPDTILYEDREIDTDYPEGVHTFMMSGIRNHTP